MYTVNTRFLVLLILTAIICLSSCAVSKNKNIASQLKTPVSLDLYNEIARSDSLLFDLFNSRKPGTDLHRELLEETMEVYPIRDYGAVQIAEHRFCHTENGKADCGTFKFIHIWKKADGNWKISRIISYDH